MLKIDEVYRWYPIYVHPRAEQKTAELLLKRGIECYLPLVKTLKQWSDRKKWVSEPLFRSYLFVHISNKEYDLVLQTPSVVRFIYFSGRAAFIPDLQIQLLKDYLAGEMVPELVNTHFAAGQKVKIIRGHLKGYEAELVSWEKQHHLILRLDALGQSLLLQIRSDDVVPVF
jgi:transcriptional antiterminator RfaH